MRKFLLLFACLLASIAIQAQSLYEVKYYDEIDQETYKGLFFYTDDETCFLRCVSKGNNYWEHNYSVQYTTEDGVAYMLMVPDEYEDNNGESPAFPTFIMAYSKSGEFDPQTFVYYEELDTDEDDPESGMREVEYFNEVDINEKDSKYFLSFYDKDEEMYQLIMDAKAQLNEQTESPADNNQTVNNNNGPVTMHFIVAAATEDETIGESVETDMKLVQKDFSQIAKMLGIGYKETLISGRRFSKSSITNAINNLNPGSNDIVVFIYSGHGFRYDDDTDAYPRMYLTYGDDMSAANEMSTTELYNMITKKNPRLTIFLTDCCNSEYGATRAQVEGVQFSTRSQGNSTDINKLKALFIDQEGTVRATAAKAGQYALCDASGGYLLTSVLNNIKLLSNALTKDAPSWNTIVQNASKFVSKKTSNQIDEAGNPMAPQEVVKAIKIKNEPSQAGYYSVADLNGDNSSDSDNDDDDDSLVLGLLCIAISVIMVAGLIFIIIKKISKKK